MKVTPEIALSAEELVKEALSFQMEQATLYAFNFTPSGEMYGDFGLRDFDIYDLLESETAKRIARTNDFVGIATTGNARPIDSDPDDESDVRRCRLFCVVSREGIVSVLRFEDTPTEELIDEGEATGSLRDALLELYV